MFGLGPATRIYIAVGGVDMRKGFDGLYGLVRDRLGHDPLSGHLFLFANRGRTRLKVLVWDGSGLWVCAKRLEKGRFSLARRCGRKLSCNAAGRVGDAAQRTGYRRNATAQELAAATSGSVEHFRPLMSEKFSHPSAA
jgi:transposase